MKRAPNHSKVVETLITEKQISLQLFVSKSCEKHIIHSEKFILPGSQHEKKTPRKTSIQLKCRHYACSEYSKPIFVYVAKARCPELWSKLEEDKRWLSEIVVLWIRLWNPRYEIKKAGISQTTFSYFRNIFAKAAMLKELPQYPHDGLSGFWSWFIHKGDANCDGTMSDLLEWV
jgi:hypothetical protein